MICKSLKQLRSMVNEQAFAIRQDISNAISNFIRTKNTSAEELSRALGLDENAINALLHGTRDITLVELITLMMATDKVVKIEDINEAMGNIANHNGIPFGRMPMGNRNPMPPFGGMPTPPQFGDQMFGKPNPFGAAPNFPQYGTPVAGGQKRNPIFSENNEVSINPSDDSLLPDFDELSRPELIDFVRNHVENWQQSIGNLDTAKRSDIINFLNSIPLDSDSYSTDESEKNEQPMPQNDAFNYEQIGKNIAKMAENNPALAQMLETLMKR